jgi:OmcA/MtrC family decaheme c-type cytochrome
MAILLVLFFMAAVFAIAALVEEKTEGQNYTALEKDYYISEAEATFIRPGLKIIIQDLTIPADRKPLVTVKYTDNLDQPLDRLGVLTPGAVSSSFILAYLPASQAGEVTDYVAYTTRTVTSPITGVRAVQAGADSGGVWTEVGGGVYTYKFGTTLPANYSTTLTHTLGIYGRRDLREWGLSFYAANPTRDFVPNGSAVKQIHEIAVTTSCNACHDPLALHGETGRREVQVCILCHSPQTIDPDTGEPQDMKVLIHKVHRSSSLPSVLAGKPYIIIGNQQSVNDFSHIRYPMDIRNCNSCHKNSKQVNAWKLFPSIEACGSCHDDVDFKTGANHVAGAYPDNSECASCHQPEGSFEYDASIAGAHTVPYKSNQLEYPKLNIISITNTAPGQNPTVRFKITDKNGTAMDPARFGGTLGRFSSNLAGPTTDYTTRITETISGATAAGGGEYTYTYKTIKVPADATGTWALQFEGRLTATLVRGGNPTDTFTQRDAMDNVVKYFAVTGTTVTPRRTVVSLASCNKCHDKLQLHGGNRNTIESCVVCHNPKLTGASNPAGTRESFSMQYMVHKIHTGEELENDYYQGLTNNYKEVLYVGDRRNCLACHVGNTYVVPLPATNVAVDTPKNYWTPTLPITTACITCHDSISTVAHAFINTTTLGGMQVESCAVCHKEGADFAVSKAHAR